SVPFDEAEGVEFVQLGEGLAGTHPDETLAKLYELHSLGFVERYGVGWQLTNGATQASNARRGGT
ncbi:hypothetical protein EF906_34695, partial [Streptomyces sp. WAC08241]